jgi:hypothetical protein
VKHQPRVSSTFETWDEILKNDEELTDARERLGRALRRLEVIDPQSPHWLRDTKHAEVNDIVITPHVEYLRNKTAMDSEEHAWVPAPGGPVLTKLRRSVVLEKFQGGLKLGAFTTFSKTPMHMKRKQKVFDEVQNKEIISLNTYVHIVSADHTGESGNYPECLTKGAPVYYRAAPGCGPGKVKDSFMDPHIPYLMTNETPFKNVGSLADEQDEERLDAAVEKAAKRTKDARAMASAAKRERERKAKARIERFRPRGREEQHSSFNSDTYDGSSASPHKQPPQKRLRRNSHGYIDADAPDPEWLLDPDGDPLPYDTVTRDGESSKSKIPDTALGRFNINTKANSKSAMSYAGLDTPQGIPKY